MALVEVQRAAGGYTEHLNPFEVVIDDEVVGLLGKGESWVFELSGGSHEIFVRLYWCRSEKVHVELEDNDEIGFQCKTRANLLTDGYWASLGRRRYLRMERVLPVGGRQVESPAVSADAQESPAFRTRRPGLPLLLIGAAACLSLFSSQGVGFLASIAVIAIAVQAIIALNFFVISPRFGSVPGAKSHDPFRFQIVEELIVSGLFAVAGMLVFVGIFHEDTAAGLLAGVAAAMGLINVIATRRLAEKAR